MKLLIPLLAFGLFSVLASYSCGRYCHNPAPHTKAVLIWRDAKAAALADVYNLTPESVALPVNLFNNLTTERSN